jgi:hypothetical protein
MPNISARKREKPAGSAQNENSETLEGVPYPFILLFL